MVLTSPSDTDDQSVTACTPHQCFPFLSQRCLSAPVDRHLRLRMPSGYFAAAGTAKKLAMELDLMVSLLSEIIPMTASFFIFGILLLMSESTAGMPASMALRPSLPERTFFCKEALRSSKSCNQRVSASQNKFALVPLAFHASTQQF